MEFIRKALAQVQEHLANLDASQKMLLVICVAGITAGLVWLFHWSGQPELVPLLDQPFTPAELGRIENQLDLSDVYYKVEGGKVLVQRKDQDRLIAKLQLAKVLPADLSESWRKWLETDMWMPAEDRRHRRLLAREHRLAGIIRLMDGVDQAYVIINEGSKRLLSEGPVSEPSASAYLQMERGVKPNARLVEAVADLVASAVDRLVPQRVSVIVGGASYRVRDKDAALASSTLLEARRENERYYAEKIENVLGIEGVRVAVHVDMETEVVRSEEDTYSGEPAVLSERSRERSQRGASAGISPGVQANTSVAVSSAGTGQLSTEEETETEFSDKRDHTRTVRQNMPLAIKAVRATINVPNSYFVELWRMQNQTEETPGEQQLQPLVSQQLEDIRAKVLPVINADVQDASQVQVSRFFDLEGQDQAFAGIGGSQADMGLGVKNYVKPVALGALAVVSLAMVLMMMRKTPGTVTVPGLEQHRSEPIKGPAPTLETDAGPVGEAETSEGILQGVEVDEDSVRVRKMAEQVAALVKDNPDAAAMMVRQWMLKNR